MEKDLKEKIDRIWLKSDFGKWCLAVSNNDEKMAKSVSEKIFNDGYLTMEMLEHELANEIAELLHVETELDEYLTILEKENYYLVDVLICVELFYDVQNLINKRSAVK